MIDDQIPALDSGQQVILLSAGLFPRQFTNGILAHLFYLGGNDAELVNIVNQCVFQWLAFSDA